MKRAIHATIRCCQSAASDTRPWSISLKSDGVPPRSRGRQGQEPADVGLAGLAAQRAQHCAARLRAAAPEFQPIVTADVQLYVICHDENIVDGPAA
jgi:hypothetical protein